MWSTIGAIFVGIGQACSLGTQILQSKAKDKDDLQKAKDELLNEFKTAYTSRDPSVVVDALRRMRQSQ